MIRDPLSFTDIMIICFYLNSVVSCVLIKLVTWYITVHEVTWNLKSVWLNIALL